MDRKTIILCLAVLAVLVLGTGVAVAFLYSGSEKETEIAGSKVADEDRYLLLSAVPSDAVAAACFSNAENAPQAVFEDLGISGDLLNSRVAVSLHYSGTLVPLYLLDAGKAAASPSDETASFVGQLRSKGYVAEYVDCSSVADGSSRIARHSLVVASTSEPLVRSSLRHIGRSVSIMSSHGFAQASAAVSGENVLFMSNSYAGKLMPAVFTRNYSSYSGFVSRLADWTVLEIKAGKEGIGFAGTAVSDGDASEFVNVLKASVPAHSSVAEVLPSYTQFAASLPVGDLDSYVEAYEAYLDTRQSLQKHNVQLKELGNRMGVSPYQFMQMIDVEEVAVASFAAGSGQEKVVLMKAGSDDLEIVFKGTDVKSLKQYEPAIHSWPYASFASVMFGSLFALKDESCFTWKDGWIITGSMAAVKEYVEGRTLGYTLQEYLADASCEDLLSRQKSSFVSYFSFTADSRFLPSVFRDQFLNKWEGEYAGAEYVPAVLHAGTGKKGFVIEASISRHTLQRTKAPAFARDTTVVVPKGPFEVTNSGTGRKNRFYQNAHLSLCLSEDGKDLWGVPFKEPLCGTAHNVDYFANGKLQILFGAGSSLYIIDRLGRYVKGFPVDLGKPILLGPDVYDFNGTRKYNVMVLHKDNTVEMYNLKGQKPSSWAGIRPVEKIKALPERIVVGGSSFWVVRTAIQTLIYPFYGGEPLSTFTGDQMIRPDSEVRAVDDTSVEASCYDGKTRVVRLK